MDVTFRGGCAQGRDLQHGDANLHSWCQWHQVVAKSKKSRSAAVPVPRRWGWAARHSYEASRFIVVPLRCKSHESLSASSFVLQALAWIIELLLLQATITIKRWTFSNGHNSGNLIAHCSPPTRLAKLFFSTHNFLRWPVDPYANHHNLVHGIVSPTFAP